MVEGSDLGGSAGVPQRRARRLPMLAAVLLCTGTLTACTDSDPSPADPSPAVSESAPSAATEGVEPDAADHDTCALLGPEALNEVLGEEAEATAIPSDGWIEGQCAWSGPTTGFILSVGTETSIRDAADSSEPDAEGKLAAFRARSSGGEGARDVEDIGDGAAIGATGMAARVGEVYLEVENLTLSESQLIDVTRLAATSVANG
jgi:hypothetical protein